MSAQTSAMSDINSDPLGRKTTQTQLPKQNNYEVLIINIEQIKDEVFWLRSSYDDQVNQIFDMTEMLGLLQARIMVLAVKIEQWVGVAEE